MIYYGAKFLRILYIAVSIYPVLFVIIAVFQAAGQSIKPFCLSLLHKGSLDIVLFFVIREVFGLEQYPVGVSGYGCDCLDRGSGFDPPLLSDRIFKTST